MNQALFLDLVIVILAQSFTIVKLVDRAVAINVILDIFWTAEILELAFLVLPIVRNAIIQHIVYSATPIIFFTMILVYSRAHPRPFLPMNQTLCLDWVIVMPVHPSKIVQHVGLLVV